ncbi:MAG: hypothetical protein JWR08_704 [Enterovirga sp.]|nr:hypothetical protein [Enterovirga sp.]
MPKRSAGLLLYRTAGGPTEVLLVHPGGPFWARRDLGAWSIPKGELDPGEDPRAGALREFAEETGTALPALALIDLGEAVQPSRKIVIAMAACHDLDAGAIVSNQTEIEWPPRSGRRILIPEIDRAAWFPLDEAEQRILPGQRVFLTRLRDAVAALAPDRAAPEQPPSVPAKD